MDLSNREWKEFPFTLIFEEIQRGKRLKKDDHIVGDTPYASSTALNNGIDGFVGNKERVRVFENCLTLANSGSVGSTFYQPFRVVASDHVTKLENKKFNKYVYLFLATLISRVSEKYGFNREINDQRIKKEKILLPVNFKGEPDYPFMESYMKLKEEELLEKHIKYISLKINNLCFSGGSIVAKQGWKEFFIEDVAKIISGRDIYEAERTKGKIPYITATANNNGIGYYVGNNNSTLEKNCLSVNRNGSVGYSFFHPYEALFGNDCRKLRLKTESKYIGLFVSHQITKQKEKYGYGYKMGTARLKRQKILLPVTLKDQPDYMYMENFMRGLEYKKLKSYLEYKLP